MKISLSLLIGLMVLMASLSCTSPQKESVFDLADAKKEIEAANREFIELFAKGDAAGVANFFTADAKSMGPNEPSHEGRKKIQTVYEGFIQSGANRLVLITTAVWGNEDLLAEEGLFTFSDKDGKQLDKGKYIVLWKKEEGRWKLFRDCYNSDLPISTGH